MSILKFFCADRTNDFCSTVRITLTSIDSILLVLIRTTVRLYSHLEAQRRVNKRGLNIGILMHLSSQTEMMHLQKRVTTGPNLNFLSSNDRRSYSSRSMTRNIFLSFQRLLRQTYLLKKRWKVCSSLEK